MVQVENTELMRRVVQAVLDIVRRRSSEDYAVVMISNVIRQLSAKYPVLTYVSVQNKQYKEIQEIISISPQINSVPTEYLFNPIRDLLQELTTSIGKTAGFFFIKELKETIGTPFDTVLDQIGVDLDSLQFQQISEKRPTIVAPTTVDILTRILETLLRTTEEATDREFAFLVLGNALQRWAPQHEFLRWISLKDPHYLQNDDMVIITPEMNTIAPEQIGTALQEILKDVNKAVEARDVFTLMDQYRTRLTTDDLVVLEAMGVHFSSIQISHETIFKQVMKALVNVLEKASTKQYAVFAIDLILKKLDAKYDFLHYVKIDSSRYTEGVDAISIMTTIDTLKPLDAGKGIQKLIEEIVKTMGDEVGTHFIDELKSSLDQVYITRMEQMGVNFHIIQLRQSFSASHM